MATEAGKNLPNPMTPAEALTVLRSFADSARSAAQLTSPYVYVTPKVAAALQVAIQAVEAWEFVSQHRLWPRWLSHWGFWTLDYCATLTAPTSETGLHAATIVTACHPNGHPTALSAVQAARQAVQGGGRG